MKLREYVKQEAERRAESQRKVLESLVVKSGVSFFTCSLAARGGLLSKYQVAKAISDATGGAVTVRELCEP